MKVLGTITEEVRAKALPWPGDNVVDGYLMLHPDLKYREQCIQLLLEAYHAFLAGSNRASIIVAGEALLRLVYDRIVCFVGNGHKIRFYKEDRTLTILDQNKDPLTLCDRLTFCDALQALKQTNLYPPEMIDKAYAVKDLRNLAAHGELPVLSEWDPDEPRNDEEFKKMFSSESYEFPEAYQFWRGNPRRLVRLNMREYAPATFRSIGWEDRFAGIQFLLVVDVFRTPPYRG
jgi:hypothetical protein